MALIYHCTLYINIQSSINAKLSLFYVYSFIILWKLNAFVTRQITSWCSSFTFSSQWEPTVIPTPRIIKRLCDGTAKHFRSCFSYHKNNVMILVPPALLPHKTQETDVKQSLGNHVGMEKEIYENHKIRLWVIT